jgi:maleamate amidohydrolase
VPRMPTDSFRGASPPPAGAEPAWLAVIDPRDREVYRRAGYARSYGTGSSPALIVVDVEYNFTGDVPADDILTSIAKYPDSCGPAAWQAIPVIAGLLDEFRRCGHPVIYTHGIRTERTRTQPCVGTDIVNELTPANGDLVIAKPAASAFFDTQLREWLTGRRVDTVVVTGCVTSGCVRATVVDAASAGFKVLVPEEAVFDRGQLPHLVNLFDMDAKYADVVSADEVAAYLSGLPAKTSGATAQAAMQRRVTKIR